MAEGDQLSELVCEWQERRRQGREASPEELCAGLPDDLRQVALWKLEGYSNEEIATRLGCVVRSVERKLAAIRATWDAEGGE
jgi:DNA-directed RNA polymerase specialized sigma24 family protein